MLSIDKEGIDVSGLTIFDRKPLRRRDDLVDFRNMIDDFFGNSYWTRMPAVDAFKMDVKETDDKYEIEAELPGVKKEDIKVSMEEGTLYISVEQEEKREEEEKDYVYRERRTRSMARSIHLRDVMNDKIEARLEDGVLHILVPKKEEEQRCKQIEIK